MYKYVPAIVYVLRSGHIFVDTFLFHFSVGSENWTQALGFWKVWTVF